MDDICLLASVFACVCSGGVRKNGTEVSWVDCYERRQTRPANWVICGVAVCQALSFMLPEVSCSGEIRQGSIKNQCFGEDCREKCASPSTASFPVNPTRGICFVVLKEKGGPQSSRIARTFSKFRFCMTSLNWRLRRSVWRPSPRGRL